MCYVHIARLRSSCLRSAVLPTACLRHDSPLEDERNNPEKIQPNGIGCNGACASEELARFDEFAGDSIIGLRGVRDAAERVLTRQRDAAQRRVPSNGATAESLPSDHQPAIRPNTETDTAQCEQTKGKTAKRNQAHSAETDANWRDGNTAKRKQRTDRIVADGNPRRHRLLEYVKSIANADVNQRQA